MIQNQFAHGISSKAYRALLNDKNRPLINRATQGQYSPASTIKPIMALAGLEDKVVTEHTRIWDPRFFGKSRTLNINIVTGSAGDMAGLMFMTPLLIHVILIFYELAYKLGVNRIAQFYGAFWFW